MPALLYVACIVLLGFVTVCLCGFFGLMVDNYV